MAGLKRLSRIESIGRNDRVIWQEMKTIKKWAERSVKPNNK